MDDGIFLGGIEAGQDLDFCAAHKITHVINCSGSSDILSQYGLKYLSLRWLEGAHGSAGVMFDPQGRTIQRIFKFIAGGRAKGEGFLIHSMDGNSRAVGVMMALGYLMRKCRWGMTKILEYIRLKRPHIHPSPTLLKQLARAAQFLGLARNDQHTTFAQRWMGNTGAPQQAQQQAVAGAGSGAAAAGAAPSPPPPLTALEILLHNTFLNGHAIPVHAPGTELEAQAIAHAQRHLAAKQRRRPVWFDVHRYPVSHELAFMQRAPHSAARIALQVLAAVCCDIDGRRPSPIAREGRGVVTAPAAVTNKNRGES